ncbi:hypothetical protein ACWE42_10360 [Sutcliffiella cohnii]
MYVVHYLQGREVILTQLRQTVPSFDEGLKIKGRKGIVTNVNIVDDKHVHVQVVLDPIIKNKVALDNSKKKKR